MYPNFEVEVVDNGSTDGSVEAIRKRNPRIEIVEAGTNMGYAGGNNVGIDRAMKKGADYILILNNDTFVDPHLLDELVLAGESNKEIGVCSPTVYDYGTESRIQATGGIIDWNKAQLHGLSPEVLSSLSVGKIVNVDIAHGCCMLVRTEVVRAIGAFDADFFSHWEEIDYCVRAKKAGFRIVWVENAKIWHKKGSARAKVSGFSEYFNSRNRILFMRKNAKKKQFLFFILYYFAFELWKTEAFYLRRFKDRRRFTFYLRGSIDGLLGRSGPCL